LTRRFGDTIAVDDLDLEVHPGEVLGFLGHNGAGKTTAVRLLNGVLAPSSGRMQVLGFDPVQQGPALRRRTGVLTETPSLDERLTARDNLTIYATLYGVPAADVAQRVEQLLETFDLAERADEKAGGYSKGMKQRLAIARALVHEPELLFLDEPTGGLDPVSARQVHQLIHQASSQQGRTVLLCTHNLPEAQRLCDRVAVMEHGKLAALGSPAELAQQFVHTARLELEVEADRQKQAQELLQEMPAVKEVEAQNHNTLLVTGVARPSIPEMIARLVQNEIPLYSVTPLEPSLEDIYFALHESLEESR
jgi:ABC-2 type transport system ATP-binding protein